MTLIVSAGAGTGTVPDVSGKPRDEAKALLKARASSDFDEEAVATPCRRATPFARFRGAGTLAERGSRVTVFISTGRTQVTVPGVIGKDKDAAVSQIEGAGLQVDVATRQTSDARPTPCSGRIPGRGQWSPRARP